MRKQAENMSARQADMGQALDGGATRPDTRLTT